MHLLLSMAICFWVTSKKKKIDFVQKLVCVKIYVFSCFIHFSWLFWKTLNYLAPKVQTSSNLLKHFFFFLSSIGYYTTHTQTNIIVKSICSMIYSKYKIVPNIFLTNSVSTKKRLIKTKKKKKYAYIILINK